MLRHSTVSCFVCTSRRRENPRECKQESNTQITPLLSVIKNTDSKSYILTVLSVSLIPTYGDIDLAEGSTGDWGTISIPA